MARKLGIYFLPLILLAYLEIRAVSLPQDKNGDPIKLSNEVLAKKVEAILTRSGDPKFEQVKQYFERQIEYNFLKKLAANVLVHRDQRTELLHLMKQTLNGQLDFKPVVENLPALLREGDEHKRFHLFLLTIRQAEPKEEVQVEVRQQQQNMTQPGQFEKVIDAASKINIKDLSGFLKEIPEIFEGIQTIVDSVDDIFGGF